MTELEIRSSIIKAVQRLTSEGLVARTWGNVSARLDSEYFIITPSGRSYENMTEDDLVKVKICDLSYEKTPAEGEPADGKASAEGEPADGKAGEGKAATLKPSSEKGIHADAYALRPEINFVIHTHQHFASAVSAAGRQIGLIPCAAYGLPGTKKLRKNVAACYKKLTGKPDVGNPGANNSSGPKAILMERHGAVCLGENLEDAFASAIKLEEECRKIFEEKVKKVMVCKVPYLDDFAQLVGRGGKGEDDDIKAIQMVTAKNSAAAAFAHEAGPMNFFDAALQRFIYKKKYSKLKNS